MNIVLNFCHKDRDLALNLLKHMREVPVCNRHEIMLQTNIHCATGGMHQELLLLSTEMFSKAEFRVMDVEEERPWPFAANNAWRDYAYFSRVTNRGPWLWLEPDCVFIPRPDRSCPVCKMEHEYTIGGKPFMGMEVTKPERRMSGVGVYPGSVVHYTRRLPHLTPQPRQKKQAIAWDQFLASDIVPNAHFTKLIQHVWNVEFGKPETIPTFPTQESLALIQPETVLFHRVKDGSLIDRLREKFNVPTSAGSPALSDSASPEGNGLGVGAPSREALEIARLKAELEKYKAQEAARIGYTEIVKSVLGHSREDEERKQQEFENEPPKISHSERMKQAWAKRKAKAAKAAERKAKKLATA